MVRTKGKYSHLSQTNQTYANMHSIHTLIKNTKEMANNKGLNWEKSMFEPGWMVEVNGMKIKCETPRDFHVAVMSA